MRDRGPLDSETELSVDVVPFARRSFDRQLVLADGRLIDRARPELWHVAGPGQVFVSTQHVHAITQGPAVTFSAHVPDAHFYNGRGGRVRPMWLDPEATRANVAPGLLSYVEVTLGHAVTAEDLLAYIAGVVAHSAFTQRFRADMKTPGVRVPLTAEWGLWSRAMTIGRRVLWLHTYGERFADPDQGRPLRPLRLVPTGSRALVREPIPDAADQMPESLDYLVATRTLRVGAGRISPVAPQVVSYQVSGVPVLKSWFEYRKRNPAIKHSSPLDAIQPREWTSEQTTELLKLLDVLAGLVALEPEQQELLDNICSGPLLTVSSLELAGVLPVERIPGPSSAPSDSGGQVGLPLAAPITDEMHSPAQRSADEPARRSRRTPGSHHTPRFRGRRTR